MWQKRRGWTPEDCIQGDIVEAFTLIFEGEPVRFLHVPNGGRLSKAQRGKVFGGLGGRAGTPDLLIEWPMLMHGRTVEPCHAWIEVKQPKRYPSPEQRAFIDESVQRLGLACAVVRSVPEALKAVADWGVPMKRDRWTALMKSYAEGGSNGSDQKRVPGNAGRASQRAGDVARRRPRPRTQAP